MLYHSTYVLSVKILPEPWGSADIINKFFWGSGICISKYLLLFSIFSFLDWMPAVCDGALSETSRHCFCTSTESPVSYDMSRCSAPQAPTRGGCLHCRRDIGAAAPSTMRSISGVDNHRQSSLGSTLELAFDFFSAPQEENGIVTGYIKIIYTTTLST